jgi:hypothetical protein
MDSMDARTLFGLFAVTAMLFCYGLEGRSHWFVLAFAGACALGSTLQLRDRSAPARLVTSDLGVRRDKAALSSGCKSHPATAPAGSSRSSYGGDEIAEAFGMRVTNW